jgi:Peptidase C39 family
MPLTEAIIQSGAITLANIPDSNTRVIEQTGAISQSGTISEVLSSTKIQSQTGVVRVESGSMVGSGVISGSGSGIPESSASGAIDDEEQDDEDISLSDDEAEMDLQKDFTAIVRQSKEYTCGPASLATLLTQLGNDTSEEKVLSYIEHLNSEKGVSLADLRQASEKLEQHTYLKKWDTETVLGYIDRTGDPVLIHDEKK